MVTERNDDPDVVIVTLWLDRPSDTFMLPPIPPEKASWIELSRTVPEMLPDWLNVRSSQLPLTPPPV
jgi:hypothetical protein